MKLLLLTIFMIGSTAFAGIEQAPPAFMVDDKKAVWADFLEARYSLEYNVRRKSAYAWTTIKLQTNEDGHIIFDSVNAPDKVVLNGVVVSQKLVSVPDNVSKVRVVSKAVPAGEHILRVLTPIHNGTRWNKVKRGRAKMVTSVSSGFFIKDLTDRLFLERYVPSNYEYDQYKMNFEVKVLNSRKKHNIFANGKVTTLGKNHFQIDYPAWYGSSSIYYHLVPVTRFVRWYLKYPSIDGRQVPVTIYSPFRFYNKMLKDRAWSVLKELEADYGPWPHPEVLIYGNNIKGGMEYPGATATSLVSLGHELQHGYFAKGVLPANGNSGWLDEAIASWRDRGHQTHDRPFFDGANLGNHSVYIRKTDKRSYEYGRSFMAYIDHKLKEIGKPGLKDFLRGYFHKRKFTTVTTEMFRSDLQDYAQMSFKDDFFQYIYGEDTKHKDEHLHSSKENPHHPSLTPQEINALL